MGLAALPAFEDAPAAADAEPPLEIARASGTPVDEGGADAAPAAEGARTIPGCDDEDAAGVEADRAMADGARTTDPAAEFGAGTDDDEADADDDCEAETSLLPLLAVLRTCADAALEGKGATRCFLRAPSLLPPNSSCS